MQRFHDAARWRVLEEACTVVLPIAERAFGLEDPWTNANLSWLARVYSGTGRYPEAERLFEQAMSIYAIKLPPRHPSVARLLVGRGRLFEKLGETAAARNDWQNAIAILEASSVQPGQRSMREAREGLTRLS